MADDRSKARGAGHRPKPRFEGDISGGRSEPERAPASPPAKKQRKQKAQPPEDWQAKLVEKIVRLSTGDDAALAAAWDVQYERLRAFIVGRRAALGTQPIAWLAEHYELSVGTIRRHRAFADAIMARLNDGGDVRELLASTSQRSTRGSSSDRRPPKVSTPPQGGHAGAKDPQVRAPRAPESSTRERPAPPIDTTSAPAEAPPAWWLDGLERALERQGLLVEDVGVQLTGALAVIRQAVT